MYVEADYFMINDLKSKVEVHFCASFMSSPERESFAEIIEELYSSRANYQKLRHVAIEKIVGNLPNLRHGRRPRSLISMVRTAAAELSGREGIFHLEEEVFEF